jgi:predicted kinase
VQKQLILFCGLPGSGKTTISRKLCEVIEAKLIDLDDFKKTDVDPTLVKSQIDPPEVRWGYYQKGLCEAVRLFASGVQNIVVDEVFHLAELRQRIEDFCHQQNILISWIEIRCPYDIVAQRLLSKPRAGHILSSEEALAMYRLFSDIFEPFIANSHRHIVIDNVNPDEVNGAITHILQKM